MSLTWSAIKTEPRWCILTRIGACSCTISVVFFHTHLRSDELRVGFRFHQPGIKNRISHYYRLDGWKWPSVRGWKRVRRLLLWLVILSVLCVSLVRKTLLFFFAVRGYYFVRHHCNFECNGLRYFFITIVSMAYRFVVCVCVYNSDPLSVKIISFMLIFFVLSWWRKSMCYHHIFARSIRLFFPQRGILLYVSL